MRGKVLFRTSVLIRIKNTTTQELQYCQFILNNEAKQTVIEFSK